MKVFVSIIFILVSVALTAIVLVQEGKDAGLGTIGGIGDTYWSRNKSRSMEGNLVKITKWLAAIFLILAVLLNMMPDKSTTAATTTQTEASVSSTESEMTSVTEADQTETAAAEMTEASSLTEETAAASESSTASESSATESASLTEASSETEK